MSTYSSECPSAHCAHVSRSIPKNPSTRFHLLNHSRSACFLPVLLAKNDIQRNTLAITSQQYIPSFFFECGVLCHIRKSHPWNMDFLCVSQLEPTATATDALHQSILRFNASDNANVYLEFQLHSTKTNIYKISGDSITSFLFSLPEHSVHTMSSLHPTLAQTP